MTLPAGHLVRFKGPADRIFDSFQEQGAYFLDTFCPDWKNTGCYLFPPTIAYDHPEICDSMIDQLRTEAINGELANEVHGLVKNRVSKAAEAIVFKVGLQKRLN